MNVFDVFVIAGFASTVAGIWCLSPPWAAILGGLGLLAYGLAMSWKTAPRKGGK